MKLVFAILLVPALAFPKSFSDDKANVTWDCAKEATVTISANNGTYALTGACKHITVDGNNNTVKVDTADRIDMNGNGNTVNAGTLAALSVNGNNNTFAAKTHVPKVSNSGNNNNIDPGPKAK